jgi:hypothetical protein
MEIWLWIIAAWMLTKLILWKKDINIEHYVWMLLPVDMYGVTIAGVTLKPYMIFCLFLLLRMLIRHETRIYIGGHSTKVGLFLCGSVLIINILNGGNTVSIASSLMLILVYACGLTYVTQIGGHFSQAEEVIKASAIGYGLIFLLAFVLTQAGISIPGSNVLNNERLQPGIVMGFGNMLDGQYISINRLRGFTIDPNSLSGTFLPAISMCTTGLFVGKRNWKNLAGFIISLGCVIASNSRTGIVCTVFVIILGYLYSMPYLDPYRRSKSILLVLTVVIVGVAVIFVTNKLEGIVGNVLEIYENRSGLTDEYGRLLIWSNALSILIATSPLIGLGTGMIQYRTATHLMCHNTWLEWICGCGFVVGGAIVIYFAVNSIMMLSRRYRKNISRENHSVYLGTAIGLVGVIIELTTIDNLTFSYLWFLLIMGNYMVNHSNSQ